MSYFPSDIPFMSEEELKANGIRIPKSKDDLKPCPFYCGKAKSELCKNIKLVINEYKKLNKAIEEMKEQISKYENKIDKLENENLLLKVYGG